MRRINCIQAGSCMSSQLPTIQDFPPTQGPVRPVEAFSMGVLNFIKSYTGCVAGCRSSAGFSQLHTLCGGL